MSQSGSFIGGTGSVTDLSGDSGLATPIAGVIQIAGGTAITTSASGGIVTISTTGSPGWTNVTTDTQAIAVNRGYISNHITDLVTFTLPATANIGDAIEIVGNGSGGWIIAQNALQTVKFIAAATTVGAGGSTASTVRYDCIKIICTVTDTTFVVHSAVGNLTIV